MTRAPQRGLHFLLRGQSGTTPNAGERQRDSAWEGCRYPYPRS